MAGDWNSDVFWINIDAQNMKPRKDYYHGLSMICDIFYDIVQFVNSRMLSCTGEKTLKRKQKKHEWRMKFHNLSNWLLLSIE